MSPEILYTLSIVALIPLVITVQILVEVASLRRTEKEIRKMQEEYLGLGSGKGVR